MELESELSEATQAERQRGRAKSRNNRGDRQRQRGTDTEFMWFRGELRRSDLIHFTLSRGIHLPSSCNYGALFPLLIHLNVCLCLFLMTIRARTHTYTHTEPCSSVINPSLLAAVVFLSPRCCVVQLELFSLALHYKLQKPNSEPPSPHKSGTHRRSERERGRE